MTKRYKNLQNEAVKPLYRVVEQCRMCGNAELIEYLDLGFHPPSDQFRGQDEIHLLEIHYPLRVNICKKCGLSQLSHVVDPKVLYQNDYPYESSTTKTGQKHWSEFARTVIAKLKLAPQSLIVDIGSNVGTLLKFFKEKGMKVMGVDPAQNIVEIANKKNKIETICDFFNDKTARAIIKKSGKADVITGTNVFAHIDDLSSFMTAIKFLLKPKGVFIFESPYLQYLIDNLEYDTIYHEHLSYLSLRPLIPFFKRFGMEIFSIEETPIHGGSFRVYVAPKGSKKIDKSVEEMIRREEKGGLHSLENLRQFSNRVYDNRKELTTLIEKLLHKGKTIAVVSTPAKGMTLLNFCGLTNRQILFASERATLKIGRYTPGGHIPIISDEEFLKRMPDYALLLAWNFAEEIINNLKPFSDKGGKFIIPIPKPKIV
ncbi:MAG: C-methyltransferase [Parcubacteria group bacterium Athens0714_24]|nr:MAG: C-methyltransferase [Parcubacteria group bacterium Athens0714_24]